MRANAMIGLASATTISAKLSDFLFQLVRRVARNRNSARAEVVDKFAHGNRCDLRRLAQAYGLLLIEPDRKRQRQAEFDQLLVNRNGDKKRTPFLGDKGDFALLDVVNDARRVLSYVIDCQRFHI